MAEQLQGYTLLLRRLKAVGGAQAGSAYMKTIGEGVAGELKRNVPHKTSVTSGSIHLASYNETSALVVGNKVAKWIDEGTGLYGPKHQKITPKVASVLHWMGGGPSKVRLSGRSRTVKGRPIAIGIFARSTKGMKARPYVARSLVTVGTKLKADFVVKRWNDAA